MSKWDKLLSRILSMDKNMRFDELRKVLESYGYTMNAPRKREQPLYISKARKEPDHYPEA